VTEGIVCLISAVEACMSFQVRKSMKTGRIEATRRERKCLHHYLYLIDPEFGFMHVRIQGWIPYDIQVYVNGREWLARQLDKAGIGYVRHDNSLLAIDDLEAAAELCERFAHRAWKRVLNAFARRLNPMLPAIAAAGYGGYYWVLDQAEIATDVMFRTRPQLLEIWPDLVRHATLNLSSEDVLGFLGRKLHPSLKAQVVTDAKRRPQGWRVRHRMGGNWVKVYDKASVLRVETTINNPREFRVLRVFTDEHGRRERRWCPMRKGVGDLCATTRWASVPTTAPGCPGRRPVERRRRRRPGRPVPAPDQAGAHLRPLQSPQSKRPRAVPSGHGWRTRHRRLPQRRHHRPPLSPCSR
jgi:hypothetical protein